MPLNPATLRPPRPRCPAVGSRLFVALFVRFERKKKCHPIISTNTTIHLVQKRNSYEHRVRLVRPVILSATINPFRKLAGGSYIVTRDINQPNEPKEALRNDQAHNVPLPAPHSLFIIPSRITPPPPRKNTDPQFKISRSASIARSIAEGLRHATAQ